MISRGTKIGKIVDNLSYLKFQLGTRNPLGFLDLTKYCEDFIKELLNLTFGYELSNLNDEVSNYPGIDLGDTTNKVAFQITSTNTVQKVNNTLNALKPEYTQNYSTFCIFILGEKQKSYSKIDSTKATEFNFTEKNIIDIDDVLQKIVLINSEKLDPIFSLFQRELKQFTIELEEVDEEGNFQSSLFNNLEDTPNKAPLNGGKISELFDDEFNLRELQILYNNLALIPRITRELIAIITEKGKYMQHSGGTAWGILPRSLQNFIGVGENKLWIELDILLDKRIIYIGEDYIEDRRLQYVVISGDPLNSLINWSKENNVQIKKLLNTMDFTVFDN